MSEDTMEFQSFGDISPSEQELLNRRANLDYTKPKEAAAVLFSEGLEYLGVLNLAKAAEAFNEASVLDPDDPNISINLAYCFYKGGYPLKAASLLDKVVKKHPRYEAAWRNLAACCRDMGDLQSAFDCYRRAMHFNPNDHQIRSAYCWSLHHDPDLDRKVIEGEHHAFAAHYPWIWGSKWQPPARKPGRMRVGYMSPDFRAHSVGFFLERLFEGHDKERVELFTYSLNRIEDKTTKRLYSHIENPKGCALLSPEAMIWLMRQDDLDIIVDLTGHTDGCRLDVLAERVARLQVSYLGYPNQSGLPSMDAWVVDEQCNPTGTEAPGTCDLLRVPGGAWAYRPHNDLINTKVQEPPSTRNGFVTFGCFGQRNKINYKVQHAWAAIMARTPGSRLVLKNQAFNDTQLRADFLAEMEKCGIENHRIDLRSHSESRLDHMKALQELDIYLDTFPYNGTTGTCEALWSGLPVVAWAPAGGSHHSRVSASIMKHGLGLDIPDTVEGYVKMAVDLANEAPTMFNPGNPQFVARRLLQRDLLEGSSLADGKRLARGLEDLFEDALNKRGVSVR